MRVLFSCTEWDISLQLRWWWWTCVNLDSFPFFQKSKTSLKSSHLGNKKETSYHTKRKDSLSSSTSSVTSKDSSSQCPDRSHRNTHVKSSPPVTVSYVTIQCGTDGHSQIDNLGSDYVYHRRPFNRSHTMLESGSPLSLRLDRSKTTLISAKPAARPNLSRLNTNVRLSACAGTVMSGSLEGIANGTLRTAHWISENSIPSQQSTLQDMEDDCRVTDDSSSNITVFPKPSVPTHSYLVGMKGQGARSEYGFCGKPQTHLSHTPSASSFDPTDTSPELGFYHPRQR